MSETKKPLVLIADDNKDMVELEIILMKGRFEIDVVSEISDIIPTALSKPYNVLLLDIVFNGVFDKSLFDEIAATPGMPPIVIMTGLAPEVIEPYAAKIKAHKIVYKPVLIKDLITTITPIIEGLSAP